LKSLIMSNTFRSVTSLQFDTELVSDKIVLVFMKKTKDGLRRYLPQLKDLTLLSY
jgi:hypothetical protein